MRTPSRRLVVAVAAAMLGALAVAAPSGAAPTPNQPAPATDPATCAPDPAKPKRQLRAFWLASVVNIDWPSRPGLDAETLKAEYRTWLDLAELHKHNAIFVQIRPNADAFWPSPYEPWSEWLTGTRDNASPGWDPLAFAVEEAHKRNIEFHAWFNPYRASMPQGAGPNIDQLAPGHPLRQHPEWAVTYPVNAAGSRLYYNPGIPEVRSFVQTAIMDAVNKYDIDGVHFDDYFYPYPAAGQDFADDATFAQYGGGFASKADWRRDNVNKLVQELNAKIKAAKSWVKFGISPFGIWRNKATDPTGSDTNGLQSYDAIYADTKLWVRQEWIDYIVPQVYWNIGFTVADYAKLVPWWSDVVAGTKVQLYIGQADYKIGTTGVWLEPEEMSRHLTFNRGYNVHGNVHFSAKDVKADRLNGVTLYRTEHYAQPALVPVMAHLPSRPLLFPVVTRAARTADGTALTWRNLWSGWPFGDVASYAVYRFDGLTFPGACGFADASHLIGTLRATPGRDQTWVDRTAEPGRTYTYYVTALDRIWNESNPSPPRPVL